MGRLLLAVRRPPRAGHFLAATGAHPTRFTRGRPTNRTILGDHRAADVLRRYRPDRDLLRGRPCAPGADSEPQNPRGSMRIRFFGKRRSPAARRRGELSVYSRTYKLAVAIPPLLWVTLFLLVPYALLLSYSFWTVSSGTIVRQWNLENYRDLGRNWMYLQVLFRSMKIAGAVTVLALVLGYPLAYYLSFRAGARKDLLYQLVIVPLWVSNLVRGYAWKTILGSDGVLNGFLQYLHLVREPVGYFLYSPFAVVLMLTHIYTPFVFLPIYAALEHVPRPLLEASQDLGASSVQTFWRVILPLSMPGLLAGATFAFVLSLGDFLAPLLVGGPSGTMIANVVQSLFGAAFDWPLGAAISVGILVITISLLCLGEFLEKRWAFQ